MNKYVDIVPAPASSAGEVVNFHPLWPGRFAQYEGGYLKCLSDIVKQSAKGKPFDSAAARNIFDQLKALAYRQGQAAVAAIFDNDSKYSAMNLVEKDQFAVQLADMIDGKDSIGYLSVMLRTAKQLHKEAGGSTNLALKIITTPRPGEAIGYPVYEAVKEAFLEGRKIAIASANAENRYLEDIESRIAALNPATDHAEVADNPARSHSRLERAELPPHLYSGSTRPELEQLGSYYSEVVAALRNDMPRVICQRWRLHPVVIKWGAENDWHVRIGFVNRSGELRSENCINIPPPWISGQDVADLEDCTESRDGHFMSYVSLTEWGYVDHRKYEPYERPLSLEVIADNINYFRLVPNRNFVDGILNDPEFGRAVSGLTWRLLDKQKHNVALERSESGDESYRFIDEFMQEFVITSPAASSTWELSIDGRTVRTFPPGPERIDGVRQAVVDLAELSAIREQARRM